VDVSEQQREPLERLAADFAERLRRGERPSLTEYAERHPELAGEIRDLFPALALMERFGSVAGPLSSTRLRIGAGAPPVLGDYRILREVGRGGMGVVYEAEQVSLGRHVALKVLSAEVHGAGPFRERFRREARAAARLHHTNIVPVFGVGEHEGTLFYAMQYISGQGLNTVLDEVRRLRNRPAVAHSDETVTSPAASQGAPDATLASRSDRASLSAPSILSAQPHGRYYHEVARLGAQAADALHHAHQQGVLHRDVKPSNLLLDPQGALWVTDFGLAKADDSEDLTGTGDIVGTLRYMAPERFRGQADARSDVYALGATLYEMLTLQPVFDATDRLKLIDQITRASPRRPRALDPRIPHDLETIVLKGLSPEPAGRYASAGEMADDLRRFLEDRPIRARRTSARERLWRWRRRNPAAAALAFTVAALVLTTIVGVSVAAWLFRGQRDEARLARRDAVEHLRATLVARASAGRTSGRPGRRFNSLDALAEAARIRAGPDLRNEAIGCLILSDLRLARQWPAPPGGTLRMDYDDAFRRYVHVSVNGRVSVHRVAYGSEEMEVPSPGRGEVWPTLSRDGRYLCLCYGLGHRQQVWRLDSPVPTRLIDLDHTDRAIQAFRSDSRRIALAGPSGPIRLYDLLSGQLVRQLPKIDSVLSLAYDPTGRRLAVATPKSVRIIDAETGAFQIELSPAAPLGFEGLVWHPQGDRLAVVDTDLGIRIWDVATGKVLNVLEGCRSGGVIVEFNHAGDLLASSGWDDRLRLWNPDTGKLVFSTPYNWGMVRFSADDRWLAGDQWDGKIRLWEVARGCEYRTLVPNRRPFLGAGGRTFAISPDGRWWAVAMQNGIDFWDLHANRQIGSLQTGISGSLQFEASGALVAVVGTGSALRWPATILGPSALRLGPPEPIPLPNPARVTAVTPDGRVVACTADRIFAVAMNRGRPNHLVRFGPLTGARRIAVSPDGRLVVTCDWGGGGGLRVWDVDGQKEVRYLHRGERCFADFTPAGDLLATGCFDVGGQTRVGQVWEVGTWKEIYHFDGFPLAFSPDSAVLAMESGYGVVRLLESRTGVEIARLEDPNLDRALQAQFTPDRSALMMCSDDGPGIRVWDLRLIRAQLAERGLDWDLPPYPAIDPTAVPQVRVQVIAADDVKTARPPQR
jgi:serine/threonine protein kinase/WD40 repeat protein